MTGDLIWRSTAQMGWIQPYFLMSDNAPYLDDRRV